jgi:hypothetical protein
MANREQVDRLRQNIAVCDTTKHRPQLQRRSGDDFEADD